MQELNQLKVETEQLRDKQAHWDADHAQLLATVERQKLELEVRRTSAASPAASAPQEDRRRRKSVDRTGRSVSPLRGVSTCLLQLLIICIERRNTTCLVGSYHLSVVIKASIKEVRDQITVLMRQGNILRMWSFAYVNYRESETSTRSD